MGEGKFVSEFGVLMDSSDTDFKEYCGKLNLGELCGLKNYIALTYNQMVAMKNDLLALSSNNPEEKKKTLNDLYRMMLRVEDKYHVVLDLICHRNKVD